MAINKLKKLGFDLDNTIADYLPIKLINNELIKNKECKTKICKKHFTSYYFDNIKGLDHDLFIKLYKAYWNEQKNNMDKNIIKLIDSKIPKIINNLSNHYEIYIVTASSLDAETIFKWLFKNQIFIPKENLILCKPEEKVNFGIDVYIDDNYEEVALKVAANNKISIVLEQPWNKKLLNENTNKNIIPAKNWSKIESILLRK